MNEILIITVIILGAVIYLTRRIVLKVKKSKAGNPCCGCSCEAKDKVR
jgi:hypothetical protein